MLDLVDMLEENECGFFSLWCERAKIDDADVLYNSSFGDDPLFNHAVLKCTGPGVLRTIRRVSRLFASLGIRPAIYELPVHRGNVGRYAALEGYELYDSLHVLVRGTQHSGSRIRVEEASSDSSLRSWVKVYESAFELPTGWHDEVVSRAKGIAERGEAMLLLGVADGEPVACMALYFSRDIAGIYCLGTLARHRGKGYASAMINEAAKIASSMGRHLLCLQTLGRDGLLPFYEKLGFEQLFVKKIYVKSSTNSG